MNPSWSALPQTLQCCQAMLPQGLMGLRFFLFTHDYLLAIKGTLLYLVPIERTYLEDADCIIVDHSEGEKRMLPCTKGDGGYGTCIVIIFFSSSHSLLVCTLSLKLLFFFFLVVMVYGRGDRQLESQWDVSHQYLMTKFFKNIMAADNRAIENEPINLWQWTVSG